MANARGFPPVAAPHARVLILGSMPGQASLAQVQYYAHPQNAFWPIMGELLGFDSDADYPIRLATLRGAGIALWDVLARCYRPGSLDSAIAAESMVCNDFPVFFDAHAKIRAVFCNGAKAHDLYRRRVTAALSTPWRDLPVMRLPSTSPAYASVTREQKRSEWRAILPWLEAT